MKLPIVSCVLAAGCVVQSPPPSYPGGAPPASSTPAAPTSSPATALPSPDLDVPIAPDQPMPAQSYSSTVTATLGAPVKALVDGRADIYSAAASQADPDRAGVLPTRIVLPQGTHLAVTFGRVTGKVGCGTGEAQSGPDGGSCAGGNTNIQPASGFSGIVDHEATQFLVGVFVGKTASAAAPAALDFSRGAQGTNFHALRPALGQVFFIGDGQADGAAQLFFVPDGASTLALGIADAYSFTGAPGYYGDNTGGFGVTATVDAAK